MKNQLFVIPIFLRSPENYENERKDFQKREINRYGKIQYGRRYELNWPPWQFNDIIGYFEISVNRQKIISVIKYWTNKKRIIKDPKSRRKNTIVFSNDFIFSSIYSEISKYFNKPDINLKIRLNKIILELSNYVSKKNYYIESKYYITLLDHLDIENYILKA